MNTISDAEVVDEQVLSSYRWYVNSNYPLGGQSLSQYLSKLEMHVVFDSRVFILEVYVHKCNMTRSRNNSNAHGQGAV